MVVAFGEGFEEGSDVEEASDCYGYCEHYEKYEADNEEDGPKGDPKVHIFLLLMLGRVGALGE